MTAGHVRRAFPWFRESPATLLCDVTFSGLSPVEKGIFLMLRLRFWVGGPLPADFEQLDMLTGADRGTCARLVPKLMGDYLEALEDGCLSFIELQHQRDAQEKLAAVRAKSGSAGGKTSAEGRSRKRVGTANENAEPTVQANAQASAQARYSPSHSLSPFPSTSGFQEEADTIEDVGDKDWTSEYEAHEAQFPSRLARAA